MTIPHRKHFRPEIEEARKDFRRKRLFKILSIFLVVTLSIMVPCGIAILTSIHTPPGDEAFQQQLAKATLKIEKNPKDADAFWRRGQLQKYSGHAEKAIIDFRKAIEINPRLFDCRRDLADQLVDTDNWAEALPHYQHLLETIDIHATGTQQRLRLRKTFNDMISKLESRQLQKNQTPAFPGPKEER